MYHHHDEKKVSSSKGIPSTFSTVWSQVFRWKLLLILLGAIGVSFVIWGMTSDLFAIPQDVQQSRRVFAQAQRDFLKNPGYWRLQWAQVVQGIQDALRENKNVEIPQVVKKVTPQSFIAFLVYSLGVKEDRLRHFCCVPKISGSSFRIVASKAEQEIWPWHVILSLEAEVKISTDGVHIILHRLRKGSQELSPSLTWAYFGADLELLQRFPTVSVRAV